MFLLKRFIIGQFTLNQNLQHTIAILVNKKYEIFIIITYTINIRIVIYNSHLINLCITYLFYLLKIYYFHCHIKIKNNLLSKRYPYIIINAQYYQLV